MFCILFIVFWDSILCNCSYVSTSSTFLFTGISVYRNISTFFTIFLSTADLAFLYMIILVYTCGIVDFVERAFIFASFFWFFVTTYCTYCFMSTIRRWNDFQCTSFCFKNMTAVCAYNIVADILSIFTIINISRCTLFDV